MKSKLTIIGSMLTMLTMLAVNVHATGINDTFKHRQQQVGFKLVETGLDEQETEALHFIYAYAPLCDVTDYSEQFYIENIKQTFATRAEMPWGKTIPDDIFRHFVLPIRVNNEALDSSRMVFYKALRNRVSNLSMQEAILEVNHWCHEHVTYQPSDARTSTPLQSIKTGTGRCGEESTLTVAALRAVGIPARQVYTPRWAHTDDNHAWVEAWADGRWHFLGACEPEAVLDLGWFNAPASRAMLMHTRVFGDYNGPEETVLKTSNYTEVNLVGNYAKTAKIDFTITDEQGVAVPNARVEFKIYNYAEFYSAVTKYADQQGHTSLTAGLGDMLVWASDSAKRYGWVKASFGKDQTMTIKIAHDTALPDSIDIVPPPEHAVIPDVPAALAEANKVRLAQEDSIRNAYTSTFITAKKAMRYPERSRDYLVKSCGNHSTILNFLNRYQGQEERAYKLLDCLSDKDLRDVTMEVLDDNMTASSSQLSPRVEDEPLRPFKRFFEQAFAQEAKSFRENPQRLVNWVKANLRINPDRKALRYAQSPVSVYNYRFTDERSRDIFWVDVARSLDIDARKDAVTGKVQYRMGDNQPWIDVKWDATEPKIAPQGILTLNYKPTEIIDNPKYYTHFSLSKLVDGHLELLNYDENQCTWASTFKNGAKMDAGTYVLVTGTRQADGSVVATTRKFDIKEGETTTVDLVMRQKEGGIAVIGNFDSESKYFPLFTQNCLLQQFSILSSTGRGYYVLGIIAAGEEPTNHALRDIAKVSLDRPVLLLFEDANAASKHFDKNDFNLPANVKYGIDPKGSILKALKSELKLKTNQLPLFIIADTFNRIVFSKQGYTINLGDQLHETLMRLK